VKKYGERVTYLRKENGGQASAFNFGLARARGEIVALLDGDDYWLPGKLRRVMDEFAKNPEVGMVYHRLREVDEQSGTEKDGDFAAISGRVTASRKSLMSYILYPTSGLAFRRTCLEELGAVPETLRIQADAYLSGLVIFVAPVVAIDESLAVYRIHGQNLFHAQGCDASGARAGIERRIATRGELVKGMTDWLRAHGYETERGELREYLSQWVLAQEVDRFTIEAPGRLEFFRHLWRSAVCFGARVSWRHRTVSFGNAVGALVVGYEHFHLLDEWRVGLTRSLRGTGGVSAPAAAASVAKRGSAVDRTVQ
jgi:glycosyltransferase involved in cell wall biosynthesis